MGCSWHICQNGPKKEEYNRLTDAQTKVDLLSPIRSMPEEKSVIFWAMIVGVTYFQWSSCEMWGTIGIGRLSITGRHRSSNFPDLNAVKHLVVVLDKTSSP